MMIAVVHFTLKRGSFTSRQHLHDAMASIFQNEESVKHLGRAEGIQRYIADIVNGSVYTCVPNPASQAAFLWLTDREFEIVIETFFQGHLLRYTENVVRTVVHRFEQLDLPTEFYISTFSVDNQSYICGESHFLVARMWDGLKDNIAALVVSMIVVIIAKLWLVQYYQEAIAIVIGLSFLSVWELLYIWWTVHRQLISWKVNE